MKLKNFKSRITKLEKTNITEMVKTIPDYFGEFFVTKDNLRLFLKENISLLFEGLKKGDKIIYNDNSIVLVVGFSDKSRRKYIKILTKSTANIDTLLKTINWDISCDLFAKIKKNNPLIEILKKYDFEYFKDRGKEILLCRKYIKKIKK